MYASQPGSPPYHATLGSGGWLILTGSGLTPAGFQQEVSILVLSFTQIFSSSKLGLAHFPLKRRHARRLIQTLGVQVISGTCIEIRTKKFPILEGEEDEIVNEGMYGRAFCQYLERELPKAGLTVPFFTAEDWGWWIEVKDSDFILGLQIYSDVEEDQNPEAYAVMSSVTKGSKWTWKKFRKIDVTQDVVEIMDKVERLLMDDPEIELVERKNEFPF